MAKIFRRLLQPVPAFDFLVWGSLLYRSWIVHVATHRLYIYLPSCNSVDRKHSPFAYESSDEGNGVSAWQVVMARHSVRCDRIIESRNWGNHTISVLYRVKYCTTVHMTVFGFTNHQSPITNHRSMNSMSFISFNLQPIREGKRLANSKRVSFYSNQSLAPTTMTFIHSFTQASFNSVLALFHDLFGSFFRLLMIRLGALLYVSTLPYFRGAGNMKNVRCRYDAEISALRGPYDPKALHWTRPGPRFALFVG